jgi:hypothetical protein
MDLTTWFLFKIKPEYDNKVVMIEEKKKAIIKCLKDSFPGYRIIGYPYYYTTTEESVRNWPRRRQTPGETFLLIVMDRIGDLSVLRYEEKKLGIYELFVDNDMHGYNTPVTHHRLAHESRYAIIEKYRIPLILDTTSVLKTDFLLPTKNI